MLKTSKMEGLLLVLLVALQVILFAPFLKGQTSVIGDSLHFLFPAFSYFAENLINGSFPLWDPYTHAGHPFYPVLGIMHLTDPVTIAVILIGKFFTRNLLVLFNWNVFISCWVMLFGVYLVIRDLTKNSWVRLYFLPVLLFGTLLFPAFWHIAALFHFMWIPYVYYFLNQVFLKNNTRWSTFASLALFIGLQGQSYFISSLAIFLLFYFVTLLIFKRESLQIFFRTPGVSSKVAVLSVLVLLLLLQTLVLSLDQGKYVFPIRMTDSEFKSLEALKATNKIGLSYDALTASGAFSNLYNFLWLIYPNWWGKPAEVFLSFGIFTWFLSLVGIFFCRSSMKRPLLFLMGLFALLIIGPQGGLHPLLYTVFPPMKFVRHLMELSYFFSFFFLLLAALGGEVVYQYALRNFPVHRKMGGLFIFVALSSLALPFLLVPSKTDFVLQVFILLGVPLLALSYCRISGSRLSQGLFVFSILLSLWGSTHVHLREFSQLYKMTPPFQETGIRLHSEKPSFPTHREISPYKEARVYGEPVALPALATRTVSLFNHNSSSDLTQGHASLIRSYFFWHKDFFRWMRLGASKESIEKAFALSSPLFQVKAGAVFGNTDDLFSKPPSFFDHQVFLSEAKDKIEEGMLMNYAGTATVKDFGANFVEVDVESKGPGFLYWADGYDAFWTAAVEGKKAEVFKANLNFKAVRVPSGVSRVRFEYRPWPYLMAIAGFYAGCVLLFLIAFFPVPVGRGKEKLRNRKIEENFA